MKRRYIAIDQFDSVIWLKTQYPRQELLRHCGFKHADKIWRDGKDPQSPIHTGWVIGQRWFEVFALTRVGEL